MNKGSALRNIGQNNMYIPFTIYIWSALVAHKCYDTIVYGFSCEYTRGLLMDLQYISLSLSNLLRALPEMLWT